MPASISVPTSETCIPAQRNTFLILVAHPWTNAQHSNFKLQISKYVPGRILLIKKSIRQARNFSMTRAPDKYIPDINRIQNIPSWFLFNTKPNCQHNPPSPFTTESPPISASEHAHRPNRRICWPSHDSIMDYLWWHPGKWARLCLSTLVEMIGTVSGRRPEAEELLGVVETWREFEHWRLGGQHSTHR